VSIYSNYFNVFELSRTNVLSGAVRLLVCRDSGDVNGQPFTFNVPVVGVICSDYGVLT
jgi:hypothetical protein